MITCINKNTNLNQSLNDSDTDDIRFDCSILIRLMHLMSPSLPTGAFAYSQGLEWAVEAKWVKDDISLSRWLSDLLLYSVCLVDVPVLKRIYKACCLDRIESAQYWIQLLFAMRETSELLLEEQTRGRALAVIIKDLELSGSEKWYKTISTSQLACYAFAAGRWNIPAFELAHGYLWSWLENQVIAGIKLIPLGQTQGQKILFSLSNTINAAVTKGFAVKDEDIGSTMPALAIGSCMHETQYTRLFRS